MTSALKEFYAKPLAQNSTFSGLLNCNLSSIPVKILNKYFSGVAYPFFNFVFPGDWKTFFYFLSQNKTPFFDDRLIPLF